MCETGNSLETFDVYESHRRSWPNWRNSRPSIRVTRSIARFHSLKLSHKRVHFSHKPSTRRRRSGASCRSQTSVQRTVCTTPLGAERQHGGLEPLEDRASCGEPRRERESERERERLRKKERDNKSEKERTERVNSRPRISGWKRTRRNCKLQVEAAAECCATRDARADADERERARGARQKCGFSKNAKI